MSQFNLVSLRVNLKLNYSRCWWHYYKTIPATSHREMWLIHYSVRGFSEASCSSHPQWNCLDCSFPFVPMTFTHNNRKALWNSSNYQTIPPAKSLFYCRLPLSFVSWSQCASLLGMLHKINAMIYVAFYFHLSFCGKQSHESVNAMRKA